jgi:DNA-binding transcriptional MerR regulator
MHIGSVAKRIGLTPDAIRFYERSALLPRPPRTEGGFRQYSDKDVETLAFVRRVQGLGFKLSEIRSLLNLREAVCTRAPQSGVDCKPNLRMYGVSV